MIVHVFVMPFFNIGITFAILSLDGTMPDINEQLIV